jgi:hypothetical protein
MYLTIYQELPYIYIYIYNKNNNNNKNWWDKGLKQFKENLKIQSKCWIGHGLNMINYHYLYYGVVNLSCNLFIYFAL